MGYTGRLILIYVLEKQFFRTSATVLSELITSSSSIIVILALNWDRRFDTSPKFIVISYVSCYTFFVYATLIFTFSSSW